MTKYLVMYFAMAYIVACADDAGDDEHSLEHRIVRAAFWPITVTNWFRHQGIRLNRMLTILWIVLISGWFLSLIADRVP